MAEAARPRRLPLGAAHCVACEGKRGLLGPVDDRGWSGSLAWMPCRHCRPGGYAMEDDGGASLGADWLRRMVPDPCSHTFCFLGAPKPCTRAEGEARVVKRERTLYAKGWDSGRTLRHGRIEAEDAFLGECGRAEREEAKRRGLTGGHEAVSLRLQNERLAAWREARRQTRKRPTLDEHEKKA